MNLWIARDKDGKLFAFNDKPRKTGTKWYGSGHVELNKAYYPGVSWEDNEPVELRALEKVGIGPKESYALIGERLESFSSQVLEAARATTPDTVNKPNHYIGENGLEVEEVLQNFIPRYEDPYVGHRVASAIEYLLRAPLKNGEEDLEKAKQNLEQVIEYLEGEN